MTKDEFLHAKIGTALFNKVKQQIVTVVCQCSQDATQQQKDNYSAWTRSAISETGVSNGGIGDISVSECADWEVFTWDNEGMSDKLRISILIREFVWLRNEISNSIRLHERDSDVYHYM